MLLQLYLGIVARANVQQRSIHITDIQQNIDIPVYKVIIDKSRGEVSILEQDTIENVS
jgi:hypothetical protein